MVDPSSSKHPTATPAHSVDGALDSSLPSHNASMEHRIAILHEVELSIERHEDELHSAADTYRDLEQEPESRAESLVFTHCVQQRLEDLVALKGKVAELQGLSSTDASRVRLALGQGNILLAIEACDANLSEADFDKKVVASTLRSKPDHRRVCEALMADPVLESKLTFGDPRPGHTEGSIQSHIHQLNRNLLGVVEILYSNKFGPMISAAQFDKLQILIMCHDSFKKDAQPGVAINDPNSHASLARAYLETLTSDRDLLEMVQRHDEPFAIFKKWKSSGELPTARCQALLNAILDLDTFFLFQVIDNTTLGKIEGTTISPTGWFLKQAEEMGFGARPYTEIERHLRHRLEVE